VLHWRLRAMPYTYTAHHTAHATGCPIARPLFFAFPADDTSRGVSTQVAPPPAQQPWRVVLHGGFQGLRRPPRARTDAAAARAPPRPAPAPRADPGRAARAVHDGRCAAGVAGAALERATGARVLPAGPLVLAVRLLGRRRGRPGPEQHRPRARPPPPRAPERAPVGILRYEGGRTSGMRLLCGGHRVRATGTEPVTAVSRPVSQVSALLCF